jgi:hypothetical protein
LYRLKNNPRNKNLKAEHRDKEVDDLVEEEMS